METVVISVGGSLIVPEEIDIKFLKNFKKLILEQKDKKFVIITGGGKICRKYQKAASEISNLSDEELDWMGIHTTIFNAQLVRIIFKEHAHPVVITNPTEKVDFKENILVGAGWEPGHSTDNDTVLIAENLGAKKLVNLSNIDYVYDKDPKKFKDAKPIKNTNWKEFRKLLPEKWDPGLNAPFDPIAAENAEKLGLEVTVMNGRC